MRCAQCKFWKAKSSNIGQCRRYPPGITFSDSGEQKPWEDVFPRTTAHSWCGEFVAALEVKQKDLEQGR